MLSSKEPKFTVAIKSSERRGRTTDRESIRISTADRNTNKDIIDDESAAIIWRRINRMRCHEA